MLFKVEFYLKRGKQSTKDATYSWGQVCEGLTPEKSGDKP